MGGCIGCVYRTKHLALYFKATPVSVKRTAKQKRHLLADITARATKESFVSVDIIKAFTRLGYLDPTSTRLRTDTPFFYVAKPIDVPSQVQAIQEAIQTGKDQAAAEVAGVTEPEKKSEAKKKPGPKTKQQKSEVPASGMLNAWLIQKS